MKIKIRRLVKWDGMRYGKYLACIGIDHDISGFHISMTYAGEQFSLIMAHRRQGMALTHAHEQNLVLSEVGRCST